MSHIPNAASASIDDAKTKDYLLNLGNLQNRGKAGLFGAFSFTREGWRALASALLLHPLENEAVEAVPSIHGVKWVVRCSLRTPDGRNPCLTSVWIVDAGQSRPRFVTAYAA